MPQQQEQQQRHSQLNSPSPGQGSEQGLSDLEDEDNLEADGASEDDAEQDMQDAVMSGAAPAAAVPAAAAPRGGRPRTKYSEEEQEVMRECNLSSLANIFPQRRLKLAAWTVRLYAEGLQRQHPNLSGEFEWSCQVWMIISQLCTALCQLQPSAKMGCQSTNPVHVTLALWVPESHMAVYTSRLKCEA